MNSDLALAKTLQTALENGLRLTRDVVEVGEANAYFHPTEPLEFFSYAVPSQEMSAKGLHDVVDAFRRRARIPRFELIRELYPQTVELAARLGWST